MSKVKEAIIEFLKNNGPSLPIPIARQVKVDSLFVSAFLSELLSNQRIKISNMKVGGSPVYYAPGTEAGLEKYSEYLKSKEKEAYNLLKEHKFLDDSEEHPAIRVALRAIKDFAKHFESNGKLIWRYYLTPQSEYNQSPTHAQKIEETKVENVSPNVPASILSDVKNTLSPKEDSKTEVEETKEEIIEKIEEEAVEIKEIAKKVVEPKPTEIKPITEKPKELERIKPTEIKPAFINPLAQKPEIKRPKEKPKSPFCIKVMEFITNNNWTIVEEISHKAKEYNALIQIDSDLGPIIFMTQAKDKKTVSEADFTKLLGEAQAIPLPALFIANAEPKKKPQEFLDKYTSVMKYRKIE